MPEIFEYNIHVQLPEGASQQLIDRLGKFLSICEFAARVFTIKNHEYGDAIRWGGVKGAVYELIGGVSRLHHLVNKTRPTNQEAWKESVADTMLDTLNYAVIGSLLLSDDNIDGLF